MLSGNNFFDGLSEQAPYDEGAVTQSVTEGEKNHFSEMVKH